MQPSTIISLLLSLSFLLFCLLTTSSKVTLNHLSPLSGPLADCCCSAETISQNNADFQQLLRPLVTNSTYFSVFHVALTKKCPFWPEDGTCSLRDCSVCECPDEQVPELWRNGNDRKNSDQLKKLGLRNIGGSGRKSCRNGGAYDLLEDVQGVVTGEVGWKSGGEEVMWTSQENERDMVFVDLRRNVERYTGYDGEGARGIWKSIYEENCFRFARHCRDGTCTQGACKEERVLYRLISGLHTSINMHIAREYLFRNPWGFGGTWKPNIPLYVERVQKHPERIENLYFTFAVILRALSKASKSLLPDTYDYSTGDDINDAYTQKVVKNLLQHPLLAPGCTTRTFDESDMFMSSEPSATLMLSQFQGAFRNISTIMDCVGCEKCRLWGKLQFLGVGTALRILFEANPGPLKRNEVIALVNLMYKLSTSVEWVSKMEKMIADGEKQRLIRKIASWVLAILVILVSTRWIKRMMSRKRSTARPQRQFTSNQFMKNGTTVTHKMEQDKSAKSSFNAPRRRR